MKVKLINFPAKWPTEYKIIDDPEDDKEDPAWFNFMDEVWSRRMPWRWRRRLDFQMSRVLIDDDGVVDYNLREKVGDAE